MEHEREIASRAVKGDREAFGRLYELVYKDLYRFALYMLKNCQDAQDMVSEAVTDAYAGIQALQEKAERVRRKDRRASGGSACIPQRYFRGYGCEKCIFKAYRGGKADFVTQSVRRVQQQGDRRDAEPE